VSSQFHNRLVGVTIVVTCIVIFLPSIIDGKKATYQDEFVSTPINPPLQQHTKLITVDKVDNAIDEPEVDTTEYDPVVENNEWVIKDVPEPVTLDSESTKSKTPTKKVVLEQTKVKKLNVPESAWTIQLGAFQNAKNINILLKKLHKGGYQAHTIPTEVIDGELTRVFVGPDVSKEKLMKLLPKLKRLTKLQGKLLPFNAVDP